MSLARSHRILGLALGVLVSGAAPGASAQEAPPPHPAGPPSVADAAGRVHLSQSLAALAWARRYADSAARAGAPDGFDLARYRAELDTVIEGLDRYLRPEGPLRGPLTEVEITGHFLLEGLRIPYGEAKP